MNRFLKVLLCIVFFTALGLPLLRLVGAKETWLKIYGWEKKAELPEFTWQNLTNRTFQSVSTDEFAKEFFMRKFYLKTALQLRDWLNFKQFHYGYSGSIVEGRDGILFETPYTKYHLESPRAFDRKKYTSVFKLLHEIDDWCATNGADFVYVLIPDKSQVYEDYYPKYMTTIWDYSEHDVQSQMEEFCKEEGIKTFNAVRFLKEQRKLTDKWLYPPSGTHISALGNALVAEAMLKKLDAEGRLRWKVNPFTGVTEQDHEWSVDDDLGRLLNLWDTHHLDVNVRYCPHFAQSNVVMNAGGILLLGDCYREQIGFILRDSGAFARDKVKISPRYFEAKPEHYRNIASDLKLIAMVFQSFNTGDLDKREEEIRHIFTTMKKARELYGKR